MAIETMAVRNVSRSTSTISRQSSPAPAELGLVELRADVVVVEEVAHAERPERPGDEEDQVGRVAAVQDVDPALAPHPQRQPELVPERGAVLAQVAERPVALGGQRMAVDVHAFEQLVVRR